MNAPSIWVISRAAWWAPLNAERCEWPFPRVKLQLIQQLKSQSNNILTHIIFIIQLSIDLYQYWFLSSNLVELAWWLCITYSFKTAYWLYQVYETRSCALDYQIEFHTSSLPALKRLMCASNVEMPCKSQGTVSPRFSWMARTWLNHDRYLHAILWLIHSIWGLILLPGFRRCVSCMEVFWTVSIVSANNIRYHACYTSFTTACEKWAGLHSPQFKHMHWHEYLKRFVSIIN